MPPRKARAMISADVEKDELERRVDRWHVAKDIPVALILAVIVQTAGGIWWMAQLSGKIDYLIAAQTEFKAERYTREDARRDREFLEQKFTAGANADRELERRLGSLESRQDRVEARFAK